MGVVRSVRAVVIVALFAACGCASPRFVSIGPEGGTLVMPSNSSYYHEQALKMLAAKYPSGYVIDAEGEVVVGDNPDADANRQVARFGALPVSRGDANDPTQWQIIFHPKGIQPFPASGTPSQLPIVQTGCVPTPAERILPQQPGLVGNP